MTDTDKRIEALESQVRTLKRMLFGVFGLVVVGGLLAATSLQSVPDVIQAKMFEVVNDEGKTQVMLTADADGGILRIDNKNGKRIAGITATQFGNVLSVHNKDGQIGAVITATPYGGSLGISNKNGKEVAEIDAKVYGGRLSINNKDGKEVAGISADADGGGEIVTFDSKGQTTSTTP